jgi:hypothetical protein
MADAGRWQPGRLLVGWALGVLTTIGAVTLGGGWFEYRELSTSPGSGSVARRATPGDTACQVDRDGAINIGGYRVVPGQPDPCYLYRPRIRPWQWYEGLREQFSRLTGTISLLPGGEARPVTVVVGASSLMLDGNSRRHLGLHTLSRAQPPLSLRTDVRQIV